MWGGVRVGGYNRAMRRNLFALFVLLGWLVGCTGTESPVTPTLLAIGFDNRVGLLETTLLETEVPRDERVFFAERTLPTIGGVAVDEPVAADLIDRDNNRDRLVVLSRAPGDPNLSALNLYDTSNLDPNDPTSFRVLPTSPILLSFGNIVVDPTLDIVSETFCPAALQVSRTGRYVALLSRRDLPGCEDLLSDTIDIIDLDNPNAPVLIERIDDPLIDSVLYLEQQDDVLYYFREVAGGARLRELDLASLEDRARVTIDTTDIAAARPVGSALVVLENDTFTPILDFSENPVVGDAVETSSNSDRLVSDDFLAEAGVYVLGTTTLTVHLTILDEEEDSLSLRSDAEVYESLNRFIYFVSTNRINKFDALSYVGEELSSRDLLPLIIDDLPSPVFATWLRVNVSAETPE